MFTYIKGSIVEIESSYLIIDVNGIGFFFKISLNTYYKFKGKKDIFLYTHFIFREDKFELYGFYNKEERLYFKYLISVNGIGSNIAMIILSSLNINEIANAILNNNKDVFKSIKGIGDKTAKRILIELHDKINYLNKKENILMLNKKSLKTEATGALINLGFSSKKQVNELIDVLILKYPNISLGELIKKALMIL